MMEAINGNIFVILVNRLQFANMSQSKSSNVLAGRTLP